MEGVIAGTSTASTDAPNCSVQRVFNGLVSAISGHNRVVSRHSHRVVNLLLTLIERNEVVVLLATNQPDRLGLQHLARYYELSGAEIRNAVFKAAYRAARSGDVVTFDLLDLAAREEAGASREVVLPIMVVGGEA